MFDPQSAQLQSDLGAFAYTVCREAFNLARRSLHASDLLSTFTPVGRLLRRRGAVLRGLLLWVGDTKKGAEAPFVFSVFS